MKFLKLKNGEIGGVALNIENEISNSIKNNIFINEDDLVLVAVKLCEGEYKYNENYIFLKKTKEKFNIQEVYNLYSIKEEEDLFKILNPLVESIPYSYIKNYMFFSFIENIWRKYIDTWGLEAR